MKPVRRLVILTLIGSMLISGLSSSAVADGEYTPIPKSKDTHPAYISDLYTKDGKTYLVADYIQWFEGSEADRAFREKFPDSGLDGAPDGYFIVNDSPKLRTFEVSDDAEVLMQIYRHPGESKPMEIHWNEPLALSEFKNIFGSQQLLHDYPYHLTLKNGKIVSIVQQYIP